MVVKSGFMARKIKRSNPRACQFFKRLMNVVKFAIIFFSGKVLKFIQAQFFLRFGFFSLCNKQGYCIWVLHFSSRT